MRVRTSNRSPTYAKTSPRANSCGCLVWNIADGQWSRIGLEQEPARQFLLDLVGKLHGDPMQGAKEPRGRLQQRLMALRWNIFADIQQEAPFSQHAQRNMDTLLRAWMENGETGKRQQRKIRR
jgi:hypothetical protein